MSVRSTVVSLLEQVAKEQGIKLPPLSDALVLLDSGLDSLGFAILVARLEDALDVDPFATPEESYLPVTLGDFVGIYEHAAEKHAAAA